MSRRKTLGINPLDAIIPPRPNDDVTERLDARVIVDDNGSEASQATPPLKEELKHEALPKTKGEEPKVEKPSTPTKVKATLGANESSKPSMKRVEAKARRVPARSRTEEKVLEVERLVLKDQNGSTRATLTCREDGQVALSLCDSNGKPRLEIQVSDSGRARVVMLDADQEIRALLGADEAGKPNLVLGDRDQKPRIALGVMENKSCFVRLFREDGQTPFAGLP